jgi:hypothetical protein
MTDLWLTPDDIAAIRARAEELSLVSWLDPDTQGLLAKSAADVPALLAWVEALTAERDHYRQTANVATKNIGDWQEMEAERDALYEYRYGTTTHNPLAAAEARASELAAEVAYLRDDIASLTERNKDAGNWWGHWQMRAERAEVRASTAEAEVRHVRFTAETKVAELAAEVERLTAQRARWTDVHPCVKGYPCDHEAALARVRAAVGSEDAAEFVQEIRDGGYVRRTSALADWIEAVLSAAEGAPAEHLPCADCRSTVRPCDCLNALEDDEGAPADGPSGAIPFELRGSEDAERAEWSPPNCDAEAPDGRVCRWARHSGDEHSWKRKRPCRRCATSGGDHHPDCPQRTDVPTTAEQCPDLFAHVDYHCTFGCDLPAGHPGEHEHDTGGALFRWPQRAVVPAPDQPAAHAFHIDKTALMLQSVGHDGVSEDWCTHPVDLPGRFCCGKPADDPVHAQRDTPAEGRRCECGQFRDVCARYGCAQRDSLAGDQSARCLRCGAADGPAGWHYCSAQNGRLSQRSALTRGASDEPRRDTCTDHCDGDAHTAECAAGLTTSDSPPGKPSGESKVHDRCTDDSCANPETHTLGGPDCWGSK